MVPRGRDAAPHRLAPSVRVVRAAAWSSNFARTRGLWGEGVCGEWRVHRVGVGRFAGEGAAQHFDSRQGAFGAIYRAAISEDEGLLSELMCGVASVVGRVDASTVSNEHALLLERGHQYPRQHMDGDSFIKSHQVVVRACGGPNDPEGSDLHVDSMDGRGDAGGSWTVYAGGEAPSRFQRLAVFASATVAMALTCVWTASVAIGRVQYISPPHTDFMAASGLDPSAHTLVRRNHGAFVFRGLSPSIRETDHCKMCFFETL